MTITSATAIINLAALTHNLQHVKQLAPRSRVLAICKANGYGHGLIEVANSLTAADAYGVARIEEAYALRSGGIVKPIVLLEGFFSSDDLPHLVASNIETVIHCEEQLCALESTVLDSPIQVWLKVDTGMTRIGISPEQLTDFYTRLQQNENIKPEIRLMTHFSCADELDSTITDQQVNQFDRTITGYTNPQSLCNSAGILNYPQYQREWIRPGIILYGVSPLEQEKNSPPLQHFVPAMTLKSTLISTKRISSGTHIGYGATYQTPHDTLIGIVAIGYGDGYPRHAQSGTPVFINGREVPLVGRVSMDMIAVDLGNESTDKMGDEVELWGENLPIERIAQHATTIPYELMCGLTSRVKLTYV